MSELMKVGTPINTTEENGLTESGIHGVIKEVDAEDEMMPYKVLLDDNPTPVWVSAGEIKEDKL
jgi:hypothetical protein